MHSPSTLWLLVLEPPVLCRGVCAQLPGAHMWTTTPFRKMTKLWSASDLVAAEQVPAVFADEAAS